MFLDRQHEAFRAAHPPATVTAAGHAWSYLRAGRQGPAVLPLGGAGKVGEFYEPGGGARARQRDTCRNPRSSPPPHEERGGRGPTDTTKPRLATETGLRGS
jgi:hypothetical protein